MELILVRHAQAEMDADHPEADPPLSDRGRRQAAALAARAASWKRPSLVVVSPARRAAQTAEPLCAALGVGPAVAEWLDELACSDGAITDATERVRVNRGLEELLSSLGCARVGTETPARHWEIAREDARLVLVGHGMAHAVALEHLLGIEGVPWAGLRFQLVHAAFTRVRAFRAPASPAWVFGLLAHNEIDHVARELRSY